jgi:hypothetical protein
MEIENCLSVNPENKNQARVFYCLRTANENGAKEHPQTVMIELGISHNFKILKSVPQSAADGWDFWIEYEEAPNLPKYFRGNLSWTPIGQY